MPACAVLIVDDDEPIRDAVRTVLEDSGFTVLEAPDGRVGLDRLRASAEPLVVLLDLMMPTMSGIELLHRVARDPQLAERDAYIIFSAARAFPAPTFHAYRLGERLFSLPKPFNLDDLVYVVEQAARQLDRDRAGGAAMDEPARAKDREGTSRAACNYRG